MTMYILYIYCVKLNVLLGTIKIIFQFVIDPKTFLPNTKRTVFFLSVALDDARQ